MKPGQRHKAYPEYRDTEVDWLGDTPAHWATLKMWAASRASSGGTPNKAERAYWDGTIPWVSPKDMKRRFIGSSQDSITEQALGDTGLRLIEPPAVLIVVRGMILAHSFPVAITTVPVTINQDMKALRFREDIDPDFMAWLFEGTGQQILGTVVDEAAHGTRAIRMDQWRSLQFPLPPAGEQLCIVAFLDRETAQIDALIAKNQRLIELLQEKRTAGVTRAVTKGLDPSAPMKDSGVEWLGMIPAHWAVQQLGQTMEGIMDFRGRTPRKLGMDWGGNIPAVSAVNVRDSHLDLARGVNYGSETLHDRWMAQGATRKGDVLFTTEAPLGNVALVPDNLQYILSQRVVLLRPHRERIVPEYLQRLLSSSAFRQGIQLHATGSTAEGVKRRYLMAMPVCIPRMEEQLAIAAILSRETRKIDPLVAKVREATGRLREYRTALISAGATGKIDVRAERSTVRA